MPRQANGTYLQPANTAAVSGQTISSTANNTLITDIGTEITNSVDRGGRSAMTAALPMGGQKITGMADPTASTDGATKNYVDTTTSAFFSTGDVKITLKTVADSGWVLAGGTSITIGNVGSGASYANANTQALYTLIWNNVADAYCPVTGGRGANAAADWAGLKPISLGSWAQRSVGIAGAQGGLTARALGQYLGEETHLLTTPEIPSHSHGITDPGHTHGYNQPSSFGFSGGGAGILGTSTGGTTTSSTTGITINNAGGGGAHNNMQPTIFVNAMIKL